MAYYGSNLITGKTAAAALTAQPTFPRPAISVAQAGQLVWQRAKISFASGLDPAINDVIELGILPAGCVLVDFVLYNDQFDSSTGSTCKVGLMTGTPGDVTRAIATVGTEIIASASTLLRGAAQTRHGSLSAAQAKVLMALTPAAADQSIGLAIQASSTAQVAATRVIWLDYAYRYSAYGE